MNVASLELSKQLWKLSGWKCQDAYIQVKDPEAPIELLSEYSPVLSRNDYDIIVSAYDLGYLLRKLPAEVRNESLTLDRVAGGWSCRYGLMSPNKIEIRADTPEDAACKLLIELIKRKVIKP